jgi:exopolysaccharide production protein ExoQ
VAPSFALVLYLAVLLWLLRHDQAREAETSVALWVPLIWMFIAGSRLPSQWLGGQGGQVAEALEEGNGLDRVVFSVLMLLAVGILASRSFRWGETFGANGALLAFLCFALLSVAWSDFPVVALKRWFRDLGNYLVILVVLTERRPLVAFSRVLRRLCYGLILISILLIKYYPEMGRGYDVWTGKAYYSGAATSKNMLGVLCLLSGLFFLWDTVVRWPDRGERRTRQMLFVNIAFIAMTMWVLNMAQSATSQICLAIGCLVIVTLHSRVFRRHRAWVKVLVPLCAVAYMFLQFGIGVNINAQLAGSVGRDPTLTDRTKIWEILLGMRTDPLVGTGYESFWLGPRLQRVWESGFGQLNEAHNGYLQVYLNLGVIGLALLCVFLMASYRTICRRLETTPEFGSLAMAMWTVLIFYSVTEAGFLGGLLWLAFLPGAMVVGGAVERQMLDKTRLVNMSRRDPETSHTRRTPVPSICVASKALTSTTQVSGNG